MAYARPGVYISERLLPAPIAVTGIADAAGAVAAPFAQGPEAVTRVTSWYEFTSLFGGYNASYPATFGVGAFFNNGGKELFVKRILHSDAVAATVDVITAGSATVATFTAKNAGNDGNNLRVAITAGTVASTYTISIYKEGVAGTAMNVTNDILLERYENVVFDDSTSTDYAETVVNLISAYVTISASAAGTPVLTVYPLTGGDNGTTVVAADYTAYKGGTSVWDEFTSFNRAFVMFMPNINDYIASNVAGVYDDAISWAINNDGFVVVETKADLSVNDAITFASGLTASSNAAVYYPHIYISDPVGRSAQALRKVGPSGAVAGLYLATDSSKGVFKAPAGLGSIVANVVSVERSFSDSELDSLNSSVSPVNPIRRIPGVGYTVMGARTLLQDGTANKYVNMRRSLIYIKKRLKGLTEFALFENNDEKLWAKVNSALTVFLSEYRNQGGLRGTQTQAFFVKCDAENNNAVSIANGEVRIQVGVALQYPAEFVVIDLSQKTLV